MINTHTLFSSLLFIIFKLNTVSGLTHINMCFIIIMCNTAAVVFDSCAAPFHPSGLISPSRLTNKSILLEPDPHLQAALTNSVH